MPKAKTVLTCDSPGCTETFTSKISLGMHKVTCKYLIPGIRSIKQRNADRVKGPRERALGSRVGRAAREEQQVRLNILHEWTAVHGLSCETGCLDSSINRAPTSSRIFSASCPYSTTSCFTIIISRTSQSSTYVNPYRTSYTHT